MFNDGNTGFEQMPGAAKKELDEVQADRAAKWAESFPNEPNPWSAEGSENASASTPEDNPVDMSANNPNQLRNTSNQVTNAIEGSWNTGNGGTNLESAYADARGDITSTQVQQLADKAEPAIADIQRTNTVGAVVNENQGLEENFGDNSPIAKDQIESDLHDLAASAATVAFDAKANAEQAQQKIENTGDTSGLAAAEQELMKAQQQIETLTQETEDAARAVENDSKLAATAKDMAHQAQDMVADAKADLQQAASEAEQQAEEMKTKDEIQIEGSPNIQPTAEFLGAPAEGGEGTPTEGGDAATQGDTLPGENQQLNPELTQPVEDDREGPLISIFG